MAPTTTDQDATNGLTTDYQKKKRGLEEIDDLFAAKKTAKKQRQQVAKEEQQQQQQRAKQKKKQHNNNNNNKPPPSPNDWVDDGLGGRYNSEGYTGRVEDGVRVFKAHVLASSDPKAGTTDDCPFDCRCCFI